MRLTKLILLSAFGCQSSYFIFALKNNLALAHASACCPLEHEPRGSACHVCAVKGSAWVSMRPCNLCSSNLSLSLLGVGCRTIFM